VVLCSVQCRPCNSCIRWSLTLYGAVCCQCIHCWIPLYWFHAVNRFETGLEKWNAVARQPVMSQAKFRTAVPSLSTGGRPSGVIGNGRGETRCNATPSCMSLSVRPSLVTLHTSTTSIKYPIRTFLSPGLTAAFAKSGRERPVKETVHRNMSADNIPTQGIKCPRRHLSGMYFRQNIMSYAESGWETPGQRIFREGGSVHDVV